MEIFEVNKLQGVPKEVVIRKQRKRLYKKLFFGIKIQTLANYFKKIGRQSLLVNEGVYHAWDTQYIVMEWKEDILSQNVPIFL